MAFEMTTKFAGQCVCGARVAAGVKVMYDRDQKPMIRTCPSCSLLPSEMAGTPLPAPTQNIIVVKVERVQSDNQDGAWVVARCSFDPDNIPEDAPVGEFFSVIGNLGKVETGDLLEVYGSWQNDSKWGWQYKAIRASRMVGGSIQALAAFLTRLPNIGKARARDIIAHFGTKKAVLDAIQQGEPLTAVTGITMERALEIKAAYEGEGELRETAMYLAGKQLGEALTAQIIDEWGKDARRIIEENPYELMQLRGVGFRRADELALGRLGIHPHDPRRAAAAVLFLLQEEEEEGHTWTDVREMVGYTPIEGL